jgi:hypothetical protein
MSEHMPGSPARWIAESSAPLTWGVALILDNDLKLREQPSVEDEVSIL